MISQVIGLVSLELDLHAHVIAQRLREHFDADARVFATDDYFPQGRISSDIVNSAVVTDYSGHSIKLSDVSTVWWRRANQSQKSSNEITPDTHEFISSEWKFSLTSVWISDCEGNWINNPCADANATAKNVQLKAALKAGLHVPPTIISNCPQTVRSFIDEHNGSVVIKKIAGVAGSSLATVEIQGTEISDKQISMCPAVYQRKLVAELHLRVLVLGDRVTTIAFKSGILDWRRNLDFKADLFRIDVAVSKSLVTYLRILGLEMGIVDMIIDNKGHYNFLEINPQGQFLFLEKIAGVDLTQACAEYFYEVDRLGFWYK